MSANFWEIQANQRIDPEMSAGSRTQLCRWPDEQTTDGRLPDWLGLSPTSLCDMPYLTSCGYSYDHMTRHINCTSAIKWQGDRPPIERFPCHLQNILPPYLMLLLSSSCQYITLHGICSTGQLWTVPPAAPMALVLCGESQPSAAINSVWMNCLLTTLLLSKLV
jgi:hypothetical protein